MLKKLGIFILIFCVQATLNGAYHQNANLKFENMYCRMCKDRSFTTIFMLMAHIGSLHCSHHHFFCSYCSARLSESCYEAILHLENHQKKGHSASFVYHHHLRQLIAMPQRSDSLFLCFFTQHDHSIRVVYLDKKSLLALEKEYKELHNPAQLSGAEVSVPSIGEYIIMDHFFRPYQPCFLPEK